MPLGLGRDESRPVAGRSQSAHYRLFIILFVDRSQQRVSTKVSSLPSVNESFELSLPSVLGVYDVSARCLEDVCQVSGRCLLVVCKISARYQPGAC